MVDKEQKTAAVTDVAISVESNIKKKEHKKRKKHHGLKENWNRRGSPKWF